MAGLITTELQKALTRAAKSDKPLDIAAIARSWGVPVEMVQGSLKELLATKALQLESDPEDISILTHIDVSRVVIYAVPIAQPRLIESAPPKKGRLESNLEDITDIDGETIRATVLQEKEGDAWTGFWLLNVCRNPGAEDAEFIVVDQRFDSQDGAWGHWDELKADLSPFAKNPDELAFEPAQSYRIGDRTFALDLGPADGGEHPWVCEIYEDFNTGGSLSDLVASFGGQTESEVWDQVKEWWTKAHETAPLFDWLRGLESTQDFTSDSDETSEFDGDRVIEVDQDTYALIAESFGCRSVITDASVEYLVHDGDLFVASESGHRCPTLPSAEVPASPTVREHILGNGTSIRVFDVESDQGAVDLMQASGYERVTLEIASIEDVETNLALEELAAKHGEIEIYSIYDPFVPADQSEYSYVVAVKPCAAEEPAPAAKPKRSK